jgi:hypothetical protein
VFVIPGDVISIKKGLEAIVHIPKVLFFNFTRGEKFMFFTDFFAGFSKGGI